MRRWLVAVVLVLTVVVTATGCLEPVRVAGIDGQLTDDWAALAEPEVFTPVAGSCHDGQYQAYSGLQAYQPVYCTEQHTLETAYVGTFTGPAARRSKPPSPGSADWAAAYRQCDQQADRYVSGAWRTTRLNMRMTLPTTTAWTAGARWFRCDLYEYETPYGTLMVVRTGGLRAVLLGSPHLRLGCVAIVADRRGENIEEMNPVDCRTPHNGEFVGVSRTSAAEQPSREQDWEPLYDACYRLVAKHLGTVQARVEQRIRLVLTLPDQDDWEAGNRSFWCFLWLEEQKVSRSLKGAGLSGLPG